MEAIRGVEGGETIPKINTVKRYRVIVLKLKLLYASFFKERETDSNYSGVYPSLECYWQRLS